ncbi:glycosyl hydrolase family 18 [Trichoderma arundinaceum]|uniref:chitinase n=1 Tax=Trichoderma arundinaceum TaxID=490622 RepID=A0A395NQN8_TRIAR|nr:glycosyl hydrolase family 18 [Trichoderma arundinaceum]
MVLSLGYLFTHILLVAGTVIAQHESNSIVNVLTRSNTERDASLAEWRALVERTSPEAIQTCPSSCQDAGSSVSDWFLFPDATSLTACNDTMLLELAIQNNANSQTSLTAIRGCKADYGTGEKAFAPKEDVAAICSTPNHNFIKSHVVIGELSSIPDKSFSLNDVLSAGNQVLYSLSAATPSCTENTLIFGYSQSAVIGLFAGAEVEQHALGAEVLGKFLKQIEQDSISKTSVAQLCNEGDRGSDYAVGIVVSSSENLPFVQDVVKAWADGRCVSATNINKSWMEVGLRVPSKIGSSNNTSVSEGTNIPAHAWGKSRLSVRATCKTTTIVSGDGCDAVAKRCGISQSDLTKFNPQSNFCKTLVPGQKVCCSSGTLPDPIPPANSDGTCKTISVVSGDGCGSLASKCGLSSADFTKLHSDSKFCSSLQVGQRICCTHGTLPDLTPKPNPDGSCSSYTVKQDDSCATIGAPLGLTVDKIESLNKKTWGWNGCTTLWVGAKLCLSTGTPPFPGSVSNALCGPTVPGTKMPSGSTSDTWAKINPCPLNVCCNIWGQCGMTDDFCVISKSSTGAPGTAAPGKNGCISSCGRDIVKGSAPAKTIKVAYFEAWNSERGCLNMDVDQIDTSKYTHIHFAFANVTTSFNVDIGSAKAQFDRFKTMTGIKKIISFGGWDFSTKPGTFNILREAVKSANRATFQKNVIAFVNDNKLDGVDLDWEYPGAPDIPDIPAGDAAAGEDFYQFLTSLKTALGTKSVSFAAPASYWYLKAYPVDKMGAKLDYIVYMTYDLHGQWDYNNQWTSAGCPTGNCLRSHVNETETKDALAMITKAGVPSNKVVVGVASYGRSFKMAKAGCTGPMCQFTGSPRVSNAAKGRCTGTAGYISNAEINDILIFGKVTKQFTDAGSNILVYNDTEWVAYMNDSVKADRAKLYASYNFAGTSDWAVDLQQFVDNSGQTDDYPDDYEFEINLDYYVDCDSVYTDLDQIKDKMDSVPPYCMNQYIVDAEISMMDDALNQFKDLVDNGYDDKFQIYEEYTTEQVPVQINAFMGNGHADDYFKCEEYSYVTCCSSCRYATCNENCDNSSGCQNGYGYHKVTCPTVYKDGSDGIDWYNTNVPNVTYTLEDSDAFYKTISDEYGIDESWIAFGDVDVRVSNGCQYAGDDIKECQKQLDKWFWNYPIAGDVKVFNPKDIIGESYDKSKDLLRRLRIMRAVGNYDDYMQWSDLVDAAALPSLSMQVAVESMQAVAKAAEEIKKAEREQMILSFITGVLFFIPFVGDAVGAAGMTAVRTTLELLGAAGDAGLLAYGIVQDPKNAFMTIFSTLAGAGIGRAGWRDAASARRDLSTDDIGKLGTVKDKLDLIQDVRIRSCKI